MNKDKAKAFLQGCPPHADPRNDPDLRQAFEAMENDGDLASWFQREKEFDHAVSSKLKTVFAPPGLRDEILTCVAAPAISLPWVRIRHAAAAAILFLAVGLAFIFSRHDGSDPTIGAQFSADLPWELISYFEREPVFDQLSGNMTEVRNHLKAHGGPETDAIPAALEDMARYRCRIYGREERKVALICMQQEGKRLHLFVLDEIPQQDGTGDRPVPRFTERDPWAFADWEHSGKTYVLATQGSADELKSVLASQ